MSSILTNVASLLPNLMCKEARRPSPGLILDAVEAGVKKLGLMADDAVKAAPKVHAPKKYELGPVTHAPRPHTSPKYELGPVNPHTAPTSYNVGPARNHQAPTMRNVTGTARTSGRLALPNNTGTLPNTTGYQMPGIGWKLPAIGAGFGAYEIASGWGDDPYDAGALQSEGVAAAHARMMQKYQRPEGISQWMLNADPTLAGYMMSQQAPGADAAYERLYGQKRKEGLLTNIYKAFGGGKSGPATTFKTRRDGSRAYSDGTYS